MYLYIYIYYIRLSIIEWLHSLLMLFFPSISFLRYRVVPGKKRKKKPPKQPKSFLVSKKYGVTLVLEVSGVAMSIHHHPKFSFFLILCVCVFGTQLCRYRLCAVVRRTFLFEKIYYINEMIGLFIHSALYNIIFANQMSVLKFKKIILDAEMMPAAGTLQ